ncbi:MAG: methyltransferase [Candidatus Bathyarchaeia archaeon]
MLAKRGKNRMTPKSDKRSEHYFAEQPKSKPRLGLLHVHLHGRSFQFMTASGVFSKRRLDLGTQLLIESMVLPKGGYVLDIGCGYGAVGTVAASLCPDLYVVMVDVNRRAAWLAKQNLEINCVSNAEVRCGYLYEPVKEMQFKCVLSNPPVSAGMNVVRALICEASSHMEAKSTLQMVVRSKIAGRRLLSFFEEAFGNVSVLARKSGYRVLIAEKT